MLGKKLVEEIDTRKLFKHQQSGFFVGLATNKEHYGELKKQCKQGQFAVLMKNETNGSYQYEVFYKNSQEKTSTFTGNFQEILRRLSSF